MYRVYWSEEEIVCYEDFGDNELSEALAKTNELRNKGFQFVTMVAGDVPGMVGKMGVAQVGSDYAWTKRRSTALRKDVEHNTRETVDWPDEA